MVLGAKCRILVSSKLFSVLGLILSKVRWLRLCFAQKAFKLAGSLALLLIVANMIIKEDKEDKEDKEIKEIKV